MQKVGVFVCWCGSNIAATVDVEKVAQMALLEQGVVHAEDYPYMCSEAGQQRIAEAIREKNLEGIVVCSCSPRMHEATFRKAAAAEGLNPYMVEIANIREQCSWIHKDKEEGGHQHLGHLLDAGVDALIDHEGGGAQEEDEPDDGLHGRGDETAEEAVSFRCGGGAAGEEGKQVLEDPAADGAVVGQDHHGDDTGHNADPAPLGVQDFVGGERALAGLTADGDLGGQQSKTKGQRQNDIDQQEDAAAVLGCQIGETPDVAQTDGRACRSQNKAQRTGEITAFLFHNINLLQENA
mgnify:CR=1 FL=1